MLDCRERLVAPGMIDAVVFERQTSQVELRDSHGEVRIGRERLLPVTVIRAGLFYR